MADLQDWVALAEDDAEHEHLVTNSYQEVMSKLTALEELAPFSGQQDHLDAYVEIACKDEQLAYRQCQPLYELASQFGYSVTIHDEGYQCVALEIEGHLAYGRIKALAGHFKVLKPTYSPMEKSEWMDLEVRVYPVSYQKAAYNLSSSDLKIDYSRDCGRGCCGYRPPGVRVTHIPSKIDVTVSSFRGIRWCKDKAMHLLYCKLRSIRRKE
jgi:protein subunit release factor A